LLDVVSGIEEDKLEVMLVGHNPGLENLLERLTGTAERMPTAALAMITLNAEKWDEAQTKGGRLDRLVKAKELAKR
ncbi:MAG TPA: hypothetical protein VJT09_03010, partial [Pyrinomonadaceae bacterium]|nr:hypothetical protein [Pyrinomonadaceae bacterium]